MRAAPSKGEVEVVAHIIGGNEGEVSHGDASSSLAGSAREIRTMASSLSRSLRTRTMARAAQQRACIVELVGHDPSAHCGENTCSTNGSLHIGGNTFPMEAMHASIVRRQLKIKNVLQISMAKNKICFMDFYGHK